MSAFGVKRTSQLVSPKSLKGIYIRLALFRLYVGRPDHLRPLLGFVSDEFAEVGGRHRHWHAAQLGEPRLEFGICKARVDLSVEPIDDVNRRALGHANAMKCDRLITRYEFAHSRNLRQCWRACCRGHRQ